MRKVFHILGWSGLPEFTSKLLSFNKANAHFSVGKMIYWVVVLGNGQVEFTGWANYHPVNLLFTSLPCKPCLCNPCPSDS